MMKRTLFAVAVLGCLFPHSEAAAREKAAVHLNALIRSGIAQMPRGGIYARYQSSRPGQEFDDLWQTVADLQSAIPTPSGIRLRTEPSRASRFSFCSSATYLLFVWTLQNLQDKGLKIEPEVLAELSAIGDPEEVIAGRLDGIGLFGHWNADGPGVAVLFHRLGLGSNFTRVEQAKPGDFLKIFWNDQIGKGERGHLVVYLGSSPDRRKIKVWSSNQKNEDGTEGYGTMWVDRSRMVRTLFSRLEHPGQINRWVEMKGSARRSDYLVRIRQTGSTEAEMLAAAGVKL